MSGALGGCDSARFYENSGRIRLCAMPDLFLWEMSQELETILDYFDVILIHELTHWAGEAHSEDGGDVSWGWNVFIEKARNWSRS